VTRRQVLFAVAALASTLACARVERLLDRSPKPSPEDGAWALQRDLWTRKASVYDGFAMRVLAAATYQAPEVRRTRAERTAQWKAMTAPERGAVLAQEEGELATFDEFLLWITTSDPSDNDLTSRDTAWRIALVLPGGVEVLAQDVVELRSDALLRTLYPDIGDFDLVYRLRFQRPPGVQTWTGPFSLRIAGPRGRLEFPFGDGAPAAQRGVETASVRSR
jgi:hypothetical protein